MLKIKELKNQTRFVKKKKNKITEQILYLRIEKQDLKNKLNLFSGL